MRETTGNVQKLRAVSPAYAGREGELTEFLQLIFQVIRLGERGERELAEALYQIAQEDLVHLQKIGNFIAALGAEPVFTACPPYPVSWYSAACVCYDTETEQMLEADIALKKRAIYLYEGMLSRLEGEDARTVGEILQREREHLKTLAVFTRRTSRA